MSDDEINKKIRDIIDRSYRVEPPGYKEFIRTMEPLSPDVKQYIAGIYVGYMGRMQEETNRLLKEIFEDKNNEDKK